MNCTGFKLIGYDNLNKILVKEHGYDSIDYLTLSSLVKDKIFLDIIEERGINVKREGRKAYNALLETRALKTRSIEDINNALDKEGKGAFKTFAARKEALDYAASIAYRLNFDSLYYGEPYNGFQELYKEIQSKIIKDGIDRTNKIANSNKDNEIITNEYNDIISEKDNIKKFNKLIQFLIDNGNNQDNNYVDLMMSISTQSFLEELSTRKNIAKLIDQNKIYQTADSEELGSFITDESFEGDENSLNDTAVDTMTQLWNLGIGEKNDFSDHVEEIVKYHISTLPVLNSTVKLANGKYDFDTNNLLGTVHFADEKYITQLLFSSADTTNVDNFITSLKKLAETVDNAKSLIYLHDILSENKILANKYMMVFNKPIISKIEVVINNGKPYSRISNPNTSKRNVIINKLYTYVKNNYVNDKLENARTAYENYRKIPNNKFLYDYFHSILPDIDNNTFNLAIAYLELNSTNKDIPVGKRGMQEMARIITNYAKTVSNGTKQYKSFIDNFKKMSNEEKQNVRFPDIFISKDSTIGLYELANLLENVMDISVDLNSRNSEGSLSSDVINRSYTTNVQDIISKDKPNVNDTAKAYARQKFKSNQYNNSNLLIEHINQNGDIINYGLFRKVGNEYKLTEYAKDLFHIDLLNGTSDQDTNNNILYKSMSDGDYLITAMGLFISNAREINNNNISIGQYLLPIPSDAPKNFVISAPKYKLDGLRNINEQGERYIDPYSNHPIYIQYLNIIKQELINMVHAINKMLVLDNNGYPIIENGEFIYSDEYKNNPDAFYDIYFGKKGKIFANKDGHKVLTGNIFKFKRLGSSVVNEDINNIFNNLIGFEQPIDILYGGLENGIKIINGVLKLNDNQEQVIREATATWLNEYINKSYKNITTNYKNYIEGVVTDAEIISFIVNDYLIRDSVYDMFGGDQTFYKDGQAILKRIKEIQASGSPFGITDLTRSGIDPVKTLDTITIGDRTIEIKDKFNGVTIYNTEKNSNTDTISRMIQQLKNANVSKKDIDRIISPFANEENKTTTNDAQSYITLEEWIRRLYAAGEIDKYRDLVESLINNEPIDNINWFEFANKVQVQKNFYYDLYYDEVTGIEAPRQIKNAEFVLIPKLIKGTDLEQIYNAMIIAGIDQLNTVETVKAAKHNILELWDKDNGLLSDKAINKFIDLAPKMSEEFSYNYLYRQQEVPQHMIDTNNKAAIQIMKKIMDNLNTDVYPELNTYRNNIFKNYVGNIRASFNNTCAELGIEVKDNKIVLDDNNDVALNRNVFFARFKENAAAQGVDASLLEFFDLDNNGFNNLPLFMSNVSSKLESIANSYFNSNITRQLISGWHAAQVSDFGFNLIGQNVKGKKKQITTDNKLQFRTEKELIINGKKEKVIVTEIMIPRWSNQLNGLSIDQIPDELRTMIGYRIPTEGKQSMTIFYVKDFLPDANGSTVVVPDEWVTQTGSDFDVDSIYAMSKTFYKTKDNKFNIYDNDKYSATHLGYYNFLKDNVAKAIKGKLGKEAKKELRSLTYRAGRIRIREKAIENEYKDIIDSVDQNEQGIAILKQIANEYNMPIYEEFVALPVEDRSNQAARTNAIIENFINILNHKGAYEENMTTSNFNDLKKANNQYAELVGVNKLKAYPNDFVTQLNWFNAATSGIKLKGISVNRDTFNSISNVIKGYHDTGIRVRYSTDIISYNDAVKRFGEDNIELIGNNILSITHKTFGWSNDNKNVEGYLINPYGSQTTAHILDVMKEGAVHNENTYTFNAFKTITDLGSNYDTAVGFMWQPAMDMITKKWKESNSIMNDGYSNPVTESIREIMINIGYEPKIVNHIGRDKLIELLDNRFAGDKNYLQKLGILSFSEAFSDLGLTFDSIIYKNRLTGQIKGIDAHLFDIMVLAQFEQLNRIGQDISNNLNVLTADKYGAKQSFFATRQIFDNAKIAIDNTNIKAPSSTGGATTLLESVFPNVYKGINEYLKTDINNSTYPSLASFLQMSSALSIKASESVFDTATNVFYDFTTRIKDWTKTGKINEKLYNDYKNHIINRSIVGNDASPFIAMPITIVDNQLVIPKDSINNGVESRNMEYQRVAGIRINIDINNIKVENILDPTQKEIDNFSMLTPAQKIIYIKENLSNADITGTGVFQYIDPNINDERDNKKKLILQYLNFNQGNISNDDIHRLYRRAILSNHPFIRLAAIDIAKYAYIVEGNKFRTKNVSRLIDNTPLYNSNDGGLNVAEFATKSINSIRFKDINDNSDIISYIRKNYNTFNCPSYSLKYFSNKGINLNIKPNGVIIMEGDFESTNIIVNNQPRNVIRIAKQLYIGGHSNGNIAYYPIDPLASFESHIDYGVSTALNNIHVPLNVLIAQEQESSNERIKPIKTIIDEIKIWYNGNREIIKLNQKIDNNANIIGLFRRNIINGKVYLSESIDQNNNISKKYYMAITGEKAINLSNTTNEYKKLYPNAELNSFAALINITNDDIININNDNDIAYSSINEKTPIGRALKSSVGIIQTAVRRDNKIARNIISGLNNAQIDYLNSNSLSNNAEFSINLISDYIDVEANQLLDSINRFPCKDGKFRSIDSEEVIAEVLNDTSKEDAFLNIIASANVFNKKYELYRSIDINTLDEKTKELVNKINSVITKVNANNTVRTARANWLKRWIRLHSNNPNIHEDIMNELDAYGDTGLADFWIQDVRANRNIILQTVLKEISGRVEKGRIDGINQAKDFELKIKDIRNRAAQQGAIATIESIIDDKGRLIRPQNNEWETKRIMLNDAVDNAIIKYGKNSVEHLKAKYNRNKFIADTTVHKYLPVEVVNIDGTTYMEDYDNGLLTFEKYALDNASQEFAKYKQLLQQINDVLSTAANNITTTEQDEKIASIYEQLDLMTNLIDDEGNKKVGRSKEVAEVLSTYSNGVRQIKMSFFDKEIKAGFDAKLNEMQSIIVKYESNRDANGNLLVNSGELMKIREYADAKNWMRKNTKYEVDIKDIENLNWAFDILKDPAKGTSVFTAAIKNYQAKDEYGMIDGTKIPEESRAKIKEETLRSFKYTKDNGLPYSGIIRSANDTTVIYKKAFYERLTGNKVKSKDEITIGEEINKILEKYFDNDIRKINTANISINDLIGALSVEDGEKQSQLSLKELFDLFNNTSKGKNDSIVGKNIANFIKNECIVTYELDRFIVDKAEAKSKGENYYNAWKQVFIEIDETGNEVPNRIIYGIIEPKDYNTWVDTEKTEAINILKNNTRELITPYYYQEQERIVQEYGANSSEYRKWWNDNHYYEPYSRTFKPLRIWVTLQMTDDSGQNLKGKFIPRVNQMDVVPKEELINPMYAKSGINKYIPGRGYDNPEYTKLNKFQLELMKETHNILKQYAFTNNNQRFIEEGYMPSLPKLAPLSIKESIKETLAFFGWSANVPTNDSWRNLEDMTFDKDYEVPNPMLKHLVNKTTKKLPIIPKEKEVNETDEQFTKRREEAIKLYNEIKQSNDKVHSDMLNNNWEEVMKSFIVNSARYNAVRNTKALLYNADQIINNNTAFDIRNGNVTVNRRLSSETETEYRQVNQKRTSEQLRNHIRRLVFDMYKENSSPKLVKLGSMMQNIAGTKYMMFNITGGIANVLTGSNNIMMERLAKEYIGNKEYEEGKMEWLRSSVSFMANMFNDESTTVQDGIIKLSNVVDFDRIVEVNGMQGVRDGIHKLRGLLFSPQAIGEHYMQNSTLFGMMKSNRIIKNDKDGYDIMSKEMYDRQSDKLALIEIINNDSNLLKLYNTFMDNIKSDEKLRAKYNLFKTNPIYDFVRINLNTVQQNEYIKNRKRIKKERDIEFESNPNVYDQFELKDGIARIKSDSKLTYKEYAKFVDKVKEVNKKIHGVYDKLGAAYIEHTWWGGMLMQYHKHLYPGLKKRYRWNGYYNETTESIEKGAYTSLANFLAIPFKNNIAGQDENVTDVLKAFQNYGKNLISFWTHISMNYNLLPENEKANIRRTTADFLYTGIAIMGAIVLTGMCGDDDDSIAYNLAMYQIDRLASEAMSFTPWGAYAEGEKLWSSPIAIQQTIKDLGSVAGNVAQLLFDDGFLSEYTTGRYRHMNKFEVMLLRNTPIIRNIDRITQMPENNSYYKLNENMLSIIPYKKIAEDIFN